MKELSLRITFTEPILGSLNNNPDIFDDWSKAPNEKRAEENAALANAIKWRKLSEGGTVLPESEQPTTQEAAEDTEEKVEKQTTVFPRNPDGTIFCYDYQWRGFFKEALAVGIEIGALAMGNLSKWLIRKTVDSMLFVAERRVPFLDPSGQPIKTVNLLQRPLRAMTMRGERICLARSEILPAGTQVNYTAKWLECAAKSTSKMSITLDAVIWALDYGALKGFGQWRGGGYGRFGYEITGQAGSPKFS